MAGKITALFAVALIVEGAALGYPDPAFANQTLPVRQGASGAAVANLERLARIDGIQCVPYARAMSGVQIFGDAKTWWEQAKGHYARGFLPRVGAVMAFRPYGRMVLGHVALVSRIIDSRTVLLRHANWSTIDGRRGQVEQDVPAVDTSADNNWSKVRVWFDPVQGLGSTGWPVEGFIYPGMRREVSRRANHGILDDPIGKIIAAKEASASFTYAGRGGGAGKEDRRKPPRRQISSKSSRAHPPTVKPALHKRQMSGVVAV